MESQPQNPVKIIKMFLLFTFFLNRISSKRKWSRKKEKPSSACCTRRIQLCLLTCGYGTWWAYLTLREECNRKLEKTA